MHVSMATKIMMPDGVGFVELLETFGDDLTVVNAARVSFDKVSTELTEGDKKLIHYLAKHDHVSPFFHPQVRFRLKMPIFVGREWFRHTIGFARNEVSRGYTTRVLGSKGGGDSRARSQGKAGIQGHACGGCRNRSSDHS